MKTKNDITVRSTPYLFDHNRTDEQGRKQGRWIETGFPEESELLSAEGDYVDGEPHGHWVLRFANGNVQAGPFVDGKRHGHWVERYADGHTDEGPYVNGKQHGHWVFRHAHGGVHEGPFVDGKEHGRWVLRYGNSDVLFEECYKNGKKVES